MEYKLEDYSGWLRRRITEDSFWKAARGCVVGSKACAQLAAWTPLDYQQRDLTPIQVSFKTHRLVLFLSVLRFEAKQMLNSVEVD